MEANTDNKLQAHSEVKERQIGVDMETLLYPFLNQVAD